MKKRIFLILGIFVGLMASISSLQAQQAKDYFNFEERGEAYFSFKLPSREIVQELATIMTINEVDTEKNEVTAYANKREFETFLKYGLKPTILTPPSMERGVEMFDYRSGEKYEWDKYPTYDSYVNMMAEFQTNYPTLCTTTSIGKTVKNRDLWMCKITSSENTGKKPRVLYTSTMHGDETTGYVVMLRLIDYLLSNYNTDPRVKNILDKTEVWICPITNPDGTYKNGNHTVYGATRYNANEVDLNRNFKDEVHGDHPDGEEWQPESLVFMELQDDVHFTMSANFHGGVEVVNYPWDNKYELHADNDWYKHIARQYADACQAVAPAGYMNYKQNGITNGAQWYLVPGGRQDNANYYHRQREITIELSDTKLVPESQLPKYWDWNKESLLKFIEESTYGIHGTVTDATTGAPVKCLVTIAGHDKLNSDVYSDATTGYYSRPIKAGTYTVTYKADGYPVETLEITVSDGQTVIMDVPLGGGTTQAPVANFDAPTTTIMVGGSVTFQDKSTNTPTAWEWTFQGGTPATSTQQNPSVTYNQAGKFDVTLKVTNAAGSQTITKQKFITVNMPQPVADFVGSPTEIEEGGTVTFQNKSVNATSYAWTFNGGTPSSSTAQNPQVTYNQAGEYDVTLIATNASGSVTKTKQKYIKVKKAPVPAPVADFVGTPRTVHKGETVSFKDLSTNNPTSWLWVFEGGEPATSTEQNPTITYMNTGNFAVQLTATNDGGSNTKKTNGYITVIINDGIEDVAAQTGISIHPENNAKQITIEADAPIKSVVVYDMNGRMVSQMSPNKARAIINLSSVSDGIYTITITTVKATRTEKIRIG